MKYEVHVPVTIVNGFQVFIVEASSPEDAVKQVKKKGEKVFEVVIDGDLEIGDTDFENARCEGEYVEDEE